MDSTLHPCVMYWSQKFEEASIMGDFPAISSEISFQIRDVKDFVCDRIKLCSTRRGVSGLEEVHSSWGWFKLIRSHEWASSRVSDLKRLDGYLPFQGGHGSPIFPIKADGSKPVAQPRSATKEPASFYQKRTAASFPFSIQQPNFEIAWKKCLIFVHIGSLNWNFLLRIYCWEANFESSIFWGQKFCCHLCDNG